MEFLKVVSLLVMFLNGLYSLLTQKHNELGPSLLEESKSKNVSNLHGREKREVTSKTTTITSTSKSPVLLTTRDPVYTDVVVELQIPVVSASPNLFDEFRSFLASLKNLTSESKTSSIVVVDVNFTTACYPNENGGLQCQCEEQFAWSCDKCSLFGACGNVSEQTCGCINGLPDGEFCQPVTNTPSCPRPTFAISSSPTSEAKTTPTSQLATIPIPVTTKPTTFLTVIKSKCEQHITGCSVRNLSFSSGSTIASYTVNARSIETNQLDDMKRAIFSDLSSLYPMLFRSADPIQVPHKGVYFGGSVMLSCGPLPAEVGFSSELVYAEFRRITNQNLPNTFYAELDRHLARLMTIFRQKASKTGETADALAEILKNHDKQEIHDVHTKRTTVLHALPVYLHEDVSGVFKTCTVEFDEPELDGVAVGLLTVVDDHDSSPVHYEPVKISVVMESDEVVSLPRFSDAFVEGKKYFKQTGVLRVIETPEITVNPIKAIVKCGSTVQLECSVKGYYNVTFKDSNKQGSKIITEYVAPDDCAGKSPEIFVCQLQSDPAFQKKLTLEFTNEEFVCKDNPTFGSAPEGYVVKRPCEEGKLGEISAECLANGEFGNIQNNCVLKEVKDLLDQSEKLTESTLPGFLKKLSNATVKLSKEVTDSPATIKAIVKILNNIGSSKLPIDGASMTNVLLTIDVLTSEDARTSWATLNKESENAEETKSQLNSSSSALLESIENITSLVQDEHLNIATNLIVFNKTSFTNSFHADFNSSVEVDISNSDEKRKSLTAITFFSMNIVLPPRDQVNSSTNVINGKIILIQSSGKVNNISMTYDVLNNTLDNSKCVFWNFTLFNGLGGWDDQGCILVSRKNATVSCNCNHLTSFSILMSPFVPKDPALEYITYIGIGISMASLVICLIIEAIIWRIAINNTTSYLRHVCIVNIALSLLMANIWFIVGAAISNPQNQNNLPACSAVTFFIHFFYLTLFFWMLALGLLLIKSTVNVLSVGPSKAGMLAIGFSLGYGAPLVIATVTVAVTAPPGEYVRDNNVCWLNWDESKTLLAFVIPALLIVLINLIILATVMSKLVKSRAGKNTAQDGERHILVVIAKGLAVLTPFFGLTWGLGFGTVSDPKNTGIHGAFALFNSLQGLFILVFGTLLDRKVRSQLASISQTLRSQTGTTSVRTSSSALAFLRSPRGFTNFFHRSSSGSSDSSSVNT
ncbi:hypothetical protein OJAV_G00230700 [Oryzias javanicus]|uniref:GPS domain-containing protein n=1 Tax=Oryzias javanicus TaxID=123683 RepID=A0A437BZL6_ORYJA|nr:hypothetical protein OJAV_G00230700 [Oryzias javanicus]